MARRPTGRTGPKPTARNNAIAVSAGSASPKRSARDTARRPANPSPTTPDPAAPGPATPGPAVPGPATPGPATPGSAVPGPATPSRGDPRPAFPRVAGLRLAAAAQALEALGLAVAGVFAAVSTAEGRSYQLSSGVAATLIAIGMAAGLMAITRALAMAKPWTRVPTGITQVFVIIAGITLLQGHRPAWGVPALVLAVACLAGLATPASLRALNRPPVKNEPEPKNPKAPNGQRAR